MPSPLVGQLPTKEPRHPLVLSQGNHHPFRFLFLFFPSFVSRSSFLFHRRHAFPEILGQTCLLSFWFTRASMMLILMNNRCRRTRRQIRTLPQSRVGRRPGWPRSWGAYASETSQITPSNRHLVPELISIDQHHDLTTFLSRRQKMNMSI